MIRKSLRVLFAACTLLCAIAVNAQMTAEEMTLIDEGFEIFNNETFDGNGRTCGTCHIPSESYNIFPATVKKLSRAEKDNLFARSVPGLENVALVKSHALFNISGGAAPLCPASNPECFDRDGHSGPVFRSTMGIFAQALTSTNVRPTFPGSPLVPAACNNGVKIVDGIPTRIPALLMQLGWAGDGAPGTMAFVDVDPADGLNDCQFHHGTFDPDADGTLRGFANGAIAQHSTTSLDRIEGVDFRFATDDELDAMEALQFWLGRRTLTDDENAAQSTVNVDEFDIEQLNFIDSRVALGRDHYVAGPEFAPSPPPNPPGPPPVVNDPNGGAGCNGCHINAGATTRIGPGGGGPFGTADNINFASEVELGSDDIGLAVLGVPLPHDEGGSDIFLPQPGLPALFEEAFNVQSIIEAAQKKAWFHNHRAVGDFEQAIEFYISADFIDGGPGFFSTEQVMRFGNASVYPEGTISFPYGDGVEHVGAFLRVLNAFYNLRDCERLIDEAIDRIELGVSAKNPIRHCKFNLKHARQVLKQSKLPYLHPAVQNKAKGLHGKLMKWKKNTRKLERAKRDIRAMRDAIATQ